MRKNELFWGSEMELLGGRQGVQDAFRSWRERWGGHREVARGDTCPQDFFEQKMTTRV